MATLLLRLQGPMQAWGVQSRFGVRDTAREPSKSGVIGLLCAALGRDRTEPLDDLASLRMGVRIDRAGNVLMDFHTANDVLKAAGGIKNTEISRRYYLANAAFLVGLESENIPLLEELDTALRNPKWMLFLGRKSFVPSPPVYLPDGLRLEENMLDAFKNCPWLGENEREYKKLSRKEGDQIRLMLEDEKGEILINDTPISFANRQFTPRRVHVDWIDFPYYLALEREAQEVSP
jgi:CRISPR system Cascade subunit CasD